MTRRRFWVYFLLFLFSNICNIDRVNISVAARPIADELHMSSIALGYLFSSFIWAYVLMMLPGGRLIDRVGAYRVAAVGATVWSISQMLTGAMSNFGTMLLTRLGLGVGEAPWSPVSYRCVQDWGPTKEHGAAIGLIASGQLFGPAVGAPFVAWLITLTSWRWSFVATGAIGLVWVFIWQMFVSTPEKTTWLPDAERQKILSGRQTHKPLTTQIGPVIGVGYRGLLRSPAMWGVAIAQGCAVYSSYLYLSWLPTYLQTARHMSVLQSGVFTSVPFFVGAFLMVLANWIGDRIFTDKTRIEGKRRMVVAVCLLLTATGMAIPYVQTLWLMVILTILPVTFSNTTTAANAALTSDLLRSASDAGRAFAFLVLGGNTFGLLAPIITGYIVQSTGSFTSAFVLAGLLAAIGAAVSFTMTRYTLGVVPPVKV